MYTTMVVINSYLEECPYSLKLCACVCMRERETCKIAEEKERETCGIAERRDCECAIVSIN